MEGRGKLSGYGTTLLSSQRQTKEVILTQSLNEALRNHDRLVVVGAPGAGKTTMLKYLALSFARNQALERLELDENRIPLFIPLRDFSRFLDNLDKDGKLLDVNPEFLPKFVSEYLKATASRLRITDEYLSEQLDLGNCIVLLDGLDEVADPINGLVLLKLFLLLYITIAIIGLL